MLISVFADGSSNGRSNAPIGWGWIVTDWQRVLKAGRGNAPVGTNNQAEMMGAIEGLAFVVSEGLQFGNQVELVSDSMYTLNMAQGNYMPNTNHELVKVLQSLFKEARASTRWVRGHSDNLPEDQQEPFNIMCDKLARSARDAITVREPKPKKLTKREKKAIERGLVPPPEAHDG